MTNIDANANMRTPKVLVINGEPFWQGSASGITMSKLFRGWPVKHIACLYISDIEPDSEICKIYWKLTNKHLKHIGIFYRSSRNKKKSLNYEFSNSFKEKKQFTLRLKSERWKIRKKMAGLALTQLDSYNIPDQILTEVKSFAPDIIYSMLGNNTLLQLAIEFSQMLKIPIIPHFMDDWPTSLYNSSLLRRPLRKLLLQKLQEVLDLSPIRLVIGKDMANEYSKRYKGDFVDFMNAIEPEILLRPVKQVPNRKIIWLVYVGGLHLERWKSLQDIANSIKELQLEGYKVECKFFTQPRFLEEAKKLEIPGVMDFEGSLSAEKIYEVLSEADIIIHVESFDLKLIPFTRFSISTKIPESMSVGRPIFAYGPEQLSSIRYIKNTNSGVTVGFRNEEMLISELRKLVTSKSLRESLGTKGREVAVVNHNAEIQRESFRLIFLKTISHQNKYKEITQYVQ